MEEFEDDGTWIWISLVSGCRLILAHVIGERKQYVADKLIGLTKECMASIPLYVTDGLKFYSEAFLKHYGRIARFPHRPAEEAGQRSLNWFPMKI
jgi:IS1 family transposase